MKSVFSVDLYGLMFSSDFKKQAEAAGHLLNLVNSEENNLIDYIDLLFKWS